MKNKKHSNIPNCKNCGEPKWPVDAEGFCYRCRTILIGGEFKPVTPHRCPKCMEEIHFNREGKEIGGEHTFPCPPRP